MWFVAPIRCVYLAMQPAMCHGSVSGTVAARAIPTQQQMGIIKRVAIDLANHSTCLRQQPTESRNCVAVQDTRRKCAVAGAPNAAASLVA